jgi:hypothetical protein
MAAAADLFAIAMRWEAAETTTEERERLKATVSHIVGYRARVACDPHNGIVDILVQNPAKSESDIADMLELQPSGAFGVIWDEYPVARRARVVETACNTYNEEHGLELVDASESSDSDSDSDDGDSRPSEGSD